MAEFKFEGDPVLELLKHALAAPKHSSPYGLGENPGPGLFLVKDDGIYLMSNGEPALAGEGTRNKVVYAKGFEAMPRIATPEEHSEFYDRVRCAGGGDDFAEMVPADHLKALVPGGSLVIRLTRSNMTIEILSPASESRN